MSSLYEIDRKFMELIENGFTSDCIDEETGEIDEDKIQEYLNTIPLERGIKLENYGLLIKNYDSEIKALKDEEEKLYQRRKSKEKQVQYLKDNLINSLVKFNESKYESARVVLNLKRVTSVDVQNIEDLPQKYVVTKTTTQADKLALRKAIKSGEVIKGVSLIETQSLQVK